MIQEETIIEDDFITLSQLLKRANIFESGGFIKHYINDVGVDVNGELEHRRGRKLYDGDIVQVEDQISFHIITKK